MNKRIFEYLEELIETLEKRSCDDCDLGNALHCARMAHENFTNKTYKDIVIGGVYSCRNTKYRVDMLAESIHGTVDYVVVKTHVDRSVTGWEDETSKAFIVDVDTFVREFELLNESEDDASPERGVYPF